MEELNQLEYFHALALKDLRNRCWSIGNKIIDHLIYCHLFSNQQTVNHWINEIVNWILECSNTQTKGGNFKYDYLWEAYTPFDDKHLELRFRNAIDKENFSPRRLSVNWTRNFLNDVINSIKKYSNNSKRILNREELKVIILNELSKWD